MNINPDSEVIQKTLKIIEERASKKQLINYGELYPEIGLSTESPEDRKTGADVLGEVNIISLKEKGVMVSALVVLGGQHYPAPGFFEFAVEQGKMNSGVNDFQRLDFWVQEVKKVFEAYDQRG